MLDAVRIQAILDDKRDNFCLCQFEVAMFFWSIARNCVKVVCTFKIHKTRISDDFHCGLNLNVIRTDIL